MRLKGFQFLHCINHLLIYELKFLNIFPPKLVEIKEIPFYLDLPEDGDLIVETYRKV